MPYAQEGVTGVKKSDGEVLVSLLRLYHSPNTGTEYGMSKLRFAP
jgi:hypothetical protein